MPLPHISFFFFFNDTATTEIYTLSLHDALPISVGMDKDVMKKLLRDAGVSIGKFLTFKSEDRISFKDAKKKLGLPMFVKPHWLASQPAFRFRLFRIQFPCLLSFLQ